MLTLDNPRLKADNYSSIAGSLWQQAASTYPKGKASGWVAATRRAPAGTSLRSILSWISLGFNVSVVHPFPLSSSPVVAAMSASLGRPTPSVPCSLTHVYVSNSVQLLPLVLRKKDGLPHLSSQWHALSLSLSFPLSLSCWLALQATTVCAPTAAERGSAELLVLFLFSPFSFYNTFLLSLSVGKWLFLLTGRILGDNFLSFSCLPRKFTFSVNNLRLFLVLLELVQNRDRRISFYLIAMLL